MSPTSPDPVLSGHEESHWPATTNSPVSDDASANGQPAIGRNGAASRWQAHGAASLRALMIDRVVVANKHLPGNFLSS